MKGRGSMQFENFFSQGTVGFINKRAYKGQALKDKKGKYVRVNGKTQYIKDANQVQEEVTDVLNMIQNLNPLAEQVYFYNGLSHTQVSSLQNGAYLKIVEEMVNYFGYSDNQYNHGHQILVEIFRTYGHSLQKLMALFKKAIDGMNNDQLSYRIVWYSRFNEKTAGHGSRNYTRHKDLTI